MAYSFYKWLLISPVVLYGILSGFRLNDFSEFSLQRARGLLHPFHVSVVEINHNAADKTLEVSCKIFTDDFEKVLEQDYKTKVDLINPPDKKAMDTLVKKYILSHLAITADGKQQNLVYLGFERDNEAVFSFVEAENISAVKKIEITNKLMYDMFTDQVNIVHVVVNGERKSTKLDYPNTAAKVEF